jgi:hypothetical protein
MRYVGPVAKSPLIVGILIALLDLMIVGWDDMWNAFGGFLVGYLFCRYLIVPFFATRVYTLYCNTCQNQFESKLHDVHTCGHCFQDEIKNIVMAESAVTSVSKIKTSTPTEKTIYCHHCGVKNTPANFCSTCGQKLSLSL